MEQRQSRLDPWIAVPLAAMAVVAAVDVLLGPDVVIISVLILGPLLAAFRLGTRVTAAVALVAVLISILLGVTNEIFGESTHVTRGLPVPLAGLVSVWLARLRVDRERAMVLLAVQGAVSRVLNEAPSLSDATPRLLRTIGEALDWQVGAFWEVDGAGERIRCIDQWQAPGFEAPAIRSASGDATYERGSGVPGEVWEGGRSVYVPHLRDDPTHPWAEAAASSGLTAAFAFPIHVRDSVVAVVECLAMRPRSVGAGQLEMFSALGRQIGQFIERVRGDEQRQQLLEREQAARVAAERAERRAAETVALLDTLLTRAPAGFAFIDPGLTHVRANDALAAIYGRSAREVLGRSVDEVAAKLPEVARAVRRAVETREPLTDVEVSADTPGVPGQERHWVASFYPVVGDEDQVLGVGAVAVEITDRKRAEVRQRFLAEATSALNASLDYEVTLANIARLSVPHLADWCGVDVLEHETQRIRRLAIAHSDPSKERLLWEIDRRYPPDLERDAGAAAAIRTGEPQHFERVDDELLRAGAKDEEHLRIVRELGLVSGMAVPLTSRGQPIGAVTFATAESGRILDREDLALAVELAARAGRAVENARLYWERSHIARTLQESLLPPRLPDMPGVELAARYRAAGEAGDVGGDFYDVFPTGEDTWGVVVGDVLGKGAGAAAMIGLARHTLRAAAMRDRDSVRILATLNEALYREGAPESFCTAVYLAIDVSEASMEVELTCAGHPLPLVIRRSGELESVGRPGTLLGAVARLALKPHRIRLDPGDALVVFTDGILEARSEQGVFGESRLRSLLGTLLSASARDVADQVARHAIEFQAGTPRDDLAVLVARRRDGDFTEPASAPADAGRRQLVESDA